MVLLTETPSIIPADGNFCAVLDERAVAQIGEEGGYFVHDPGDGQPMRLLRLAVPPGTPLAALIPLDQDGLDRAAAVTRLMQALLGRAVPPDPRATRQQRRRFRHILQAVDGRMSGASYREIAIVLYGSARISDQPWKTSALRDSVIALVENGYALIEGGYRHLLRHRRRS